MSIIRETSRRATYIISHRGCACCVVAGSSRDDSAEPSNLGDQFDQTSFRSVDTVPTASDGTDWAGQTGG